MKNSLILLSVLFLCGCGYTTSSTLPSSIKTIAVEKFENAIDFTSETYRDSYFPLMEVKLRNAVIDRFLIDGHLKIADSELADYVLKAKIIGYERDALRYTDDDDVQEYRVRIVVSMSVWNRQTDMLEWEEPYFAGESTYFLTGPQATTESAAVSDAITDLARRIVERTIENW
jgi:hypothetical protein